MKTTIILSLIITLVSSAVVKKWHKSADGSVYFIEAEQKYNWFEAWNECVRKNMSLIAIDTYERHYQIDALIKGLYTTCPPFWLAAHDNAVDKRYEWATTGEVFTFTNWAGTEPSRTPNEHCILWYITWDWHDTVCATKYGFICEENRFLKEKSKELALIKKQAQDDPTGMVKTFIWKNYNGNCD